MGTNEHYNKIVFIVVWKSNSFLQNINDKFWLVKYKEPLTLAVERLLPANALFRCLHDDECTGATKKKWSTNKNENLQLEQANQKFSVMIWTYNKYILEQCWHQISQTAMYMSSWQKRFLDKVLQVLQQKQPLQNQLKMLRFGAKRHWRMWSLKSRNYLFI